MTEVTAKYTYECLCKAVAYEVTGAPAMSCRCHCNSCRVYGGDAARVGLWTPEQLSYTKGRDNLIDIELAAGKKRMTCKTCGCFIQNILPNGLQVIPLGGLKVEAGPVVKPTMHIWVSDNGDLDAPSDGLPVHQEWPPA